MQTVVYAISSAGALNAGQSPTTLISNVCLLY